jgi:DNA-binding helix-hairpin-helix protein with protein kinase domain
LQRPFKLSEKPVFNAFEEGLRPGVYSYEFELVPNKLQRDREALIRAESEGDEEAVLALTMKMQRLTSYDFRSERGQIVVKKDGTIERYSIRKLADESRRLREAERERFLEQARNRGDVDTVPADSDARARSFSP